MLIANLFQFSIILYIFAAAIAVVLIKNQKMCNIFSNILCITASLLAAIASIIKLTSGNDQITICSIKSTIPFISFDMKVDNLSAFFMLSLSVLVFCVSIYSIGYISHYIGKRNVGFFNFLYSSFILSMIFVFTSSNTVFFFISWEAMSLISYFLVIFESESEKNQRAGTLYIIMTHIGAAFLMIGFLTIYSYTKSFDISTGSTGIPMVVKNVIFVLFLIGFGIKAGVIPVHIWLPLAHPAAPSNVSALMSGIMIKTAIYGILRFVFTLLGIQNTWWGAVILIIGILSTVIGVAYAFVEKNFKRLLAYSSIENIGIIFIGLGIGAIAYVKGNLTIAALAIVASLIHSFNHTLFKGGLFLGAGSIHYSTHTKNMEELGGLIKKMPVTALFVLGGALSVSALIPFNGFIGEWLLYQTLFGNIVAGHAGVNILSIVSVAALALAGALALASFVKFFGISFLGLPRSEKASSAKEVPAVMNVGTGILISLCLILGLFPTLILKVVDGVTADLMGISLLGQVKGQFLIAYYPLKISGNAISPLTIFAIMIALILLTLVIIRIIGGKYIERKYGTWDCGYHALTSRMQYSATGFSKPIKIVFRLLFRPSRNITTKGNSLYNPASIEYVTESESVFEKYLYDPLYAVVHKFSTKLKLIIQSGLVHNYLLYIFLALVICMIYNTLT